MSRPIESPIFQKYQSVITPSLSRIFIIQAGHPARPVWFLGIFSRCWQLVHFISSTLEAFFSSEGSGFFSSICRRIPSQSSLGRELETFSASFSPKKDPQMPCTSSTRLTRAMKMLVARRPTARARDQNAIHTNLRIGSGAGNHIMIGTRALLFNNIHFVIGTAPHPIAHALHPEGISNDEYDGRVSELTPPSFC